MIDEISYRLIAEHRKADTNSGDLLSMLIAARDEETGQGLKRSANPGRGRHLSGSRA